MYRLTQRCLSQTHKFKTRYRLIMNNAHIIKSPITNIQIPDVTIPQLIFENCSAHPQKIAAECAITGRKYTYEALRDKAKKLSIAIRKKLKLRKGDVVAVLLPNIPEFPIALLGILDASLIATTVSPLCTPDEIKRQLFDSGTKAVISTCSLYPIARATVPAQRTIPILTIKSEKWDTIPEGAINFEEFTDNVLDSDEVNVISSSSDYAIMPYSSGTTGDAKGVIHMHSSVIANIFQLNTPQVKLHEKTTDSFQDVIPAILPFTHMYGLCNVLLHSLASTAKLITVPTFKPEIFVDIFNKHEPTVLYAVPTAISFITNYPDVKKSHFQSVRAICSASALLSASDEERLLEKAGKDTRIVQGYGLTETGMITFTEITHKCAGSVGAPLPNTGIKVVSVDDEMSSQPLQSYNQGHLLVKGPQIMCGYHNRAMETEGTFINGWFKTGDLGYYDNSNNFYIVDRMKELIKVKGYQVAPAQLENIIRGYPNVTDAAVIGIPHATYGEVPRAYITLKPGTQVDTNKIKQFVADQVSSYKDIKGGIAIVENLPKNASGKFLRRQLKLLYSKETELHTT